MFVSPLHVFVFVVASFIVELWQAVGGKGSASRRADARMAAAFAENFAKAAKESQAAQEAANAAAVQATVLEGQLQEAGCKLEAAEAAAAHIRQELANARADLAALKAEAALSEQAAEEWRLKSAHCGEKEKAAWARWQKDSAWYKKRTRELEIEVKELTEAMAKTKTELRDITDSYNELSLTFEQDRELNDEEKRNKRDLMNAARTEIENLRGRVQILEDEKAAVLTQQQQWQQRNNIPITLIKAAPAQAPPLKRPCQPDDNAEKVWNGKKWRKISENVWEEMDDQEVIPLGDAPGPSQPRFAGVELAPKMTWEERAAAAMPKPIVIPVKGPPPAKSQLPATSAAPTPPPAKEAAPKPKVPTPPPPIKAAPQAKQQYNK
jgi:hypothetical protein